jgi:cytochrome d ubiquinol oxidase subunit II
MLVADASRRPRAGGDRPARPRCGYRAMTLAFGAALVALLAITLYAVFGGADFGGGVRDLLATGPRKQAQRDAITHAIGPVWEANHV